MRNESLCRQLRRQFFHKNQLAFGVAALAALLTGLGGMSISWILKSLIDTASGVPGALPLRTNLILSVAFLAVMVALCLLDYASQPAFIRRAMTQYKNFAFQKLSGTRARRLTCPR